MKLRKPRLWLRDIPGDENNQAFYLVWYDDAGREKKRTLSPQIDGQPFPKDNARLRAICEVQAERILRNAAKQIDEGNMERLERQVGIKQPTIRELFATWAVRETSRGKAVALKQAVVDRWRGSTKKVCKATDDDIYDFFEYLDDHLNWSRPYSYRCLRDMRHALDYGVQKGYCAINPAANVKPRKKARDHSKNNERYLTAEEVQQLLDTPIKQQWVREYFLWMLHTACGLKEVCHLRWDMIQEKDGRAMLIIPRAKNDTLTIARWVDDIAHLLPERNGEFMYPHLPRDEKAYNVFRNKMGWCLKRWSNDAGLQRNGKPFYATAYMARRTAATAVNNAEKDPLLAARAIGHVNTQHTYLYARHDDAQRANSGAKGVRYLGINDTVHQQHPKQ